MENKYYKYYQPNKKDLKDDYGDCVIRAICKAFDITWLEAFEMTLPICRECQMLPSRILFADNVKVVEKHMKLINHKVSNKRGTKRPTVKSFAKEHKTGRYILRIANHVVAVVDGKYFDTWDCGEKSLYGYYEVIE